MLAAAEQTARVGQLAHAVNIPASKASKHLQLPIWAGLVLASHRSHYMANAQQVGARVRVPVLRRPGPLRARSASLG